MSNTEIGMNKAGVLLVLIIALLFVALFTVIAWTEQVKQQCKSDAMASGYTAEQVIQVCGK